MKIFLFLALIFVSASSNAAVVERPSQKYSKSAFNSYSWMVDYKKTLINVTVSDDAKKFMNEESLKRYFKLKMRNFVKDIELIEDIKGLDYNYLYLKLELYKYNDDTGIHYGLVSLKLDSSVDFNGTDERIYELTTSIAGSESQLVSFIKQEIDSFVEVYAEDYYYLDDLRAMQNK